MARRTASALHFKGDDATWTIQDKIDFHTARGSPIVQIVAKIQIVTGYAQLLKDKGLEGRSVDVFRGIQRASWADGAIDARVENKRIRVSRQSSLGAFPEHW